MSLTTIIASLCLGLGLVTLGADWLVRGAQRIARLMGISALAVGLTVVALGTSAPEIALGLFSIGEGRAGLAVGNLVGSNIFNLLVILGAAALITPLAVRPRLLRVDLPVLIGLSLFVLLLSVDGRVGRFEGAVLALGTVAYFWTTLRIAPSRRQSVSEEPVRPTQSRARRAWSSIAFLLLGLTLLALGARLLVDGASNLARLAGISERVIGLTILAGGTSIPEVATSLIAALRGQRDLAIGNAIGSSILNLLAVLGLTALLSPQGVPIASSSLWLDLPFMVGVSLFCFPILATELRIDRREGLLLLTHYIAYVGYLVLKESGSSIASAVAVASAALLLPLSVAMVVTRLRKDRATLRRSPGSALPVED